MLEVTDIGLIHMMILPSHDRVVPLAGGEEVKNRQIRWIYFGDQQLDGPRRLFFWESLN